MEPVKKETSQLKAAVGIEDTASETSFGSLFSREQSILSDNDSYMSA